MKIIGIHDGHNAAVCLLINGGIMGLLQEERLLIEKNYFGFPLTSIAKMLEVHDLSISEIDFFVFNGKHIAYPYDKSGTLEIYKKGFSAKSAGKNLLKKTFVYDIYKNKRKENRIENLIKLGFGKSKIKFVEHHLAHASAAYYCCPWIKKDEKVLILTQYGSSDGLSGTVTIGCEGKIDRIASVKKEDSLGRIYATITYIMGMVPLDHEYKLMGMAPYAPASGREISYNVFKTLLYFSEEDSIIWKRKKGLPPMQRIYPY